MKTITWLILALGAVGVAGIAAWYFTRSRKDAIMSRCSALQAELARISTQGGDTSRQNELRAQIGACLAEAEAAGFEIDYTAVAITECNLKQTQIEQEWSHYRSTAYEDLVKRNNGRGQILKLGEEMALCYGNVLDTLATAEEIRGLQSKLRYSISQSDARANCFYDANGNTESGCSRYGYNEPEGRERANDERMRVGAPLRAVMSAASAKLAALDAAYAKERQCLGLKQALQTATVRGDRQNMALYQQQLSAIGCPV